jgi:hypothetical protein
MQEDFSEELRAFPDLRNQTINRAFFPCAETLPAAQVPITCLLGQLEYNPRHYGQEEDEAPRRQEAITPTWRQIPK